MRLALHFILILQVYYSASLPIWVRGYWPTGSPEQWICMHCFIFKTFVEMIYTIANVFYVRPFIVGFGDCLLTPSYYVTRKAVQSTHPLLLYRSFLSSTATIYFWLDFFRRSWRLAIFENSAPVERITTSGIKGLILWLSLYKI